MFWAFIRTDLPPGQITHREERLEEKRKFTQIKIHQCLPQEELPQREETLRQIFLCFYSVRPYPWGRLQREKRLRERKIKISQIKIH